MTIELANAGVEETGSCFFASPAQGPDGVSGSWVWFPLLSDPFVLLKDLMVLGWARRGPRLTPVSAFGKLSEFLGLLATRDGLRTERAAAAQPKLPRR